VSRQVVEIRATPCPASCQSDCWITPPHFLRTRLADFVAVGVVYSKYEGKDLSWTKYKDWIQGLVIAMARVLRLRRRRTRDDGWTLVELMIVIALIMLLASMSLVQYRNSIQHAKEATLGRQLYVMRDAINQYSADKGKYPDSLQTLVSEQYIRAIPVDPFTNSADTWTTVAADPEPGSISASTAIFDVRSGADGTAMDGMRLADK
jgi:general secretion pathway protein G